LFCLKNFFATGSHPQRGLVVRPKFRNRKSGEKSLTRRCPMQ
jgi:hypothetical protein